MKKCLVCGKKIGWPKRHYCSRECQRIGGVLEMHKQEPDTRQTELLYERWKNTFGPTTERIKQKEAWKFRIFVWAAIEVLGHPQKNVATVCKKDHTTILHHYQNIRWNEKSIAEEFANNARYKFKKMPIYPPDFKYVDNDKQ